MNKMGSMKCGPSNVYMRLLAGKVSSWRYAAIVKRSVGAK